METRCLGPCARDVLHLNIYITLTNVGQVTIMATQFVVYLISNYSVTGLQLALFHRANVKTNIGKVTMKNQPFLQ